MERMTNTLAAHDEFDAATLGMPIARVLLASLFLVAGVRKLLGWGATVAYFGKLGLVMPELILPLVVTLELGGAILLVVGWRLPVVSIALAAFSIAAAFAAHAFWSVEPAQFTGQLNNFLKNVAIAGGLLHVAAVASRSVRSDD